MLELPSPGTRPSGSAGARRDAAGVRPIVERLILILALGIVLAACSIPFGNGTEPTTRAPEETRRDRSRLYMQEQERMERERLFDRAGPSDR